MNYAILNLKRPGVGQYEENLTAWAPSATLGLLAKPNEKVSFGFNLRTPATIKFEGDATMSGVAALAAYDLSVPETSDVEREATWPLWAGAGLALKPTEKLTLTADLQFTQWKKIDRIEATYSDPVWTAAKLVPQVSAAFDNDFRLEWKNALQVRVGAELVPAEGWALRAGYYYDPSPSPAETLNILLPEATYHAGTIGIGRTAGQLKIDLCLEALFGAETESPLGPNSVMPGTHGMTILVPNISIGYSF
jgi:long-chain fatty acid transport protein